MIGCLPIFMSTTSMPLLVGLRVTKLGLQRLINKHAMGIISVLRARLTSQGQVLVCGIRDLLSTQMHPKSCPSIVFWQTSILKCPFVYLHNELPALKQRSAIWIDNRGPLMCEVRGKRWLKYIIIIVLENSEVQWSRGST